METTHFIVIETSILEGCVGMHRLASSGFSRLILYLYQKQTSFLFSFSVKPVFHQKPHLCWVPNANKNRTNNMKSTCPTQIQPLCTKHELYSPGSRWVHKLFWIPICCHKMVMFVFLPIAMAQGKLYSG